MKKRSGSRPDVQKLLSPLKGFQRETVDYAFRRMYLDEDAAVRFLVADEVGLGKTLIARGIIARAIDHLWETTGRIDIVYICSNAAIAQQNLQKLSVGDGERHALATRLTLLPREIQGLDDNKVNFVSFTPGTSFDLKSKGGMVHERVVLYWLLEGIVGKRVQKPGGSRTGLRNLLQGNVNQNRWLWEAGKERRPELDRSLVAAFRREFEKPEHKALRRELWTAIEAFRRWRGNWPDEHRRQRNRVLGKLRLLLARTSVDKLEPDLIILDEFQRFRHLLRGDDEMAELARSMWTYVTPEQQRTRVLLLSATPYRMYSTDHESGEEDDHYRDFIETTRFLMDGDEPRVETFQKRLRSYRKAVQSALRGEAEDVPVAREAVQEDLRRVMVRTERVVVTDDREAMMQEPPVPAGLQAGDVRQWTFVDGLSRAVGERDPIELWKSAPYLPQFMRGYMLKRKLEKKLKQPEVGEVVKAHEDALIRPGQVSKFAPIDMANARLRVIAKDLLDDDQWQLLWVPPSLPYWPLSGPFARNARFTKALVFSAWNVVPDVVSAMLSYEADRRMLESEMEGGLTYGSVHRSLRGLLRFSRSDDRLTGMTALALQYPSLTLADEISPLAIWSGGEADMRAVVRARVVELLDTLPDGEGRPDEHWYWAAAPLLDLERGGSSELDAFLGGWSLEKADTDDETALERDGGSGDDSRFKDHVQELSDVVHGRKPLGRKPDDLADVLTDLALGAPGVLAARSLLATGASSLVRRRAAAVAAEGFRTLFNQPTALAVVRRLHADVPYWRATLRYAIDGGLQAVLDEHFHQLWDQVSWESPEPDEAAERIAKEMGDAASIKTSRVKADTFKVGSAGVELGDLRLRTSFALRYGRVVGDENAAIAREGAVRKAFNSPYRPFVLASTSIGQEGLDFHPWCHAIVHWNLPGNPVDLEQREGRVHRYEGHAVRRNVAEKFGRPEVFREGWRLGQDPWAVMFEAAASAREPGTSDLIPWWVFEGETKVERRVPILPFSKEVGKLRRLKRDLVAYRLAFGQPRQQELLALVHGSGVGVEEMDAWTLDLRPGEASACVDDARQRHLIGRVHSSLDESACATQSGDGER